MRSHPVRRSPALWLALLAALLNALSPLAAYARSSAPMLPMELCSTAGPARPDSAIEVPVPGVPAGHATHLPHCAFCPASGLHLPALHTGTGSLSALLVPDRTAFIPRDVSRTQKPLYLPSRPRGPPATLHS
jgi:hypothetical protein